MAQQPPSGSGGQSLINTPFSRDPNVPVRCPPEDTSRARTGNPGFQQGTSNRSPAPPFNAHNPRSNNFDNTGSIRSRKNAPPPPIPFSQPSPAPTRSYNSYNSEGRAKNNIDSGNDWEFEDKVNRNTSAPGNRVNPIHELQMIGRRHNNNDEENGDQPPFNFQAMLRKTPHQRASMKRTAVYDSYAPSPSPYGGRPTSREDHYESNVVYRSGGSRRDSSEWSPNEMVRMSEKYGREGAWASAGPSTGGGGIDTSESVTTELAPGIVVEGYVAEL